MANKNAAIEASKSAYGGTDSKPIIARTGVKAKTVVRINAITKILTARVTAIPSSCLASSSSLGSTIAISYCSVSTMVRIPLTDVKTAKIPKSPGVKRRVRIGEESIVMAWAIAVPDANVVTLRRNRPLAKRGITRVFQKIVKLITDLE